jgi:hypothetical protein
MLVDRIRTRGHLALANARMLRRATATPPFEKA